MRLTGIFMLGVALANAQGSNCVGCHTAQLGHSSTGMAHALSDGTTGEILRSHTSLTFVQGPWKYSIVREGATSLYRVANSKEELVSPVAWAFGLGAAGQTYLLSRNGIWFESRVSYYRDIDGLDLTVGAQAAVPATIGEAFGRELSPKGAQECFNCHSTGAIVNGSLSTASLAPGVQCARCHTDAPEHAASLQTFPKKLHSMTSEETADYCGQCHRTWATIATQGPNNITNVRFQPYRLVNSRCYDAADDRIRCTTCHDPHDEKPRTLASFDTQCLACHAPNGKGKTGAKSCPTAKAECASCHMPKVLIPTAHNRFTDHWIRIDRPGVPPPL